MTSMVERVAREICLKIYGGYPVEERDREQWTQWEVGMNLARAAIKAMRDPSHAMMGSAVNQPAGDRYYSVRELEWRAAIDAALAESKEG